MFGKSLVHGGISSLSVMWLLRGNKNIEMKGFGMNKNIPIMYYALVVGALASIGSDTIHQYVKEEVPQDRKIEDGPSVALAILSATTLYGLMFACTNPAMIEEFGFGKMVGVATVSELASGYVNNMLL